MTAVKISRTLKLVQVDSGFAKGQVSKHPQRSEQKIELRNKCKMTKVMVAGREEEPVVVTLESIELDTVEQFVYL